MPDPSEGQPVDAERRNALLAGDSDAIAAWYAVEHPRVYRLALGLLADAQEAEDLAQDAMLKILDHGSRARANRGGSVARRVDSHT